MLIEYQKNTIKNKINIKKVYCFFFYVEIMRFLFVVDHTTTVAPLYIEWCLNCPAISPLCNVQSIDLLHGDATIVVNDVPSAS